MQKYLCGSLYTVSAEDPAESIQRLFGQNSQNLAHVLGVLMQLLRSLSESHFKLRVGQGDLAQGVEVLCFLEVPGKG